LRCLGRNKGFPFALAHAYRRRQPLLTNGFQFQFVGPTTANYTVQYATNLVSPVTWNPLQIISSSNGGTIPINDSAWTNSARFNRILAQ
jgi:hypothetical protein